MANEEEWKERTAQLEFLKDFPKGPLDAYRKQASFDWKVMTLVMEPENVLRFKVSYLKPSVGNNLEKLFMLNIIEMQH